jgi:CubicO group peptidase (beta-lactamase class C family)
MSVKKTIAIGAIATVVLLMLLQLVPYGQDRTNPPVVAEPAWDSPRTRELFFTACRDCHSHQTEWPWYASIAPASWLIYHDVMEGRSEVNISRWGQGKQEADEAAGKLREDEMPLWYYLPAHPEAQPTQEEKNELIRGLVATFGDEGEDGSSHMLARAEALELDTEYVPPPGDALEHHTSGFAKILCSAVFVTGLDPDFAAENVGYFTSPHEERAKVIERRIDRDNEEVHLTLPSGVTRVAKRFGDQGCVTLPIGEDSVYFTPVDVESKLPDPSTEPWPMGDVLPEEPLPSQLDGDKVAAAVNAAFEPAAGMTAAFLVTWKGRIVGERYGDGITMHTPLESWSMGKSLTATLMGVLIHQGVYDLWQPAPVPEWQADDDPRADIRIADLLRMSSGLRFRGHLDPDLDVSLGYLDHLYVYTGSVNSFQWAATRPLQWPPNTVGRYRNSDPVLVNYLIRLGVEGRGEEYLSFPQRALFDKLGIRNMVLETDPYGNFLLQGYELGAARDWARLGNLYLQDGVWMGERTLPEGYAEFVSTVAPAWEADGRPIYGGFFWINKDNYYPIPEDAYYMAGAGGQMTFIIPSHDLVVVRLGHYRGDEVGEEGLKKALTLLMEAIPASG